MAKKGKATGPVVGLDIGSRWIKAVEIRPGRGGNSITGIGYEPTPKGAVVEDAILDSTAISEAIKRLFTNGGITAKNVVSAVSGQSSVVVRIIEVPKMTTQELAETMKWEVERHIPFPSSEVVMDFKPLNRPSPMLDDQTMEVLLAVCQEDVVNKHMQTLTAAKLEPVAIEVEAVALPRSLAREDQTGDAAKTLAIVDIGAESTKVCIYENQVLVFPRNVPIAGINFVRAIAEATGAPEEEAEQALRENGAVDLEAIDRLSQPQPSPEETQMGGDSPFAGMDMDSPFLPPTMGGETEEPEAPPVADFDLGDDYEPPSHSAFGMDQEPQSPPISDEQPMDLDMAPEVPFDSSDQPLDLDQAPEGPSDTGTQPYDLDQAPEPPAQSGGGVFDLDSGDEIAQPAEPEFDLEDLDSEPEPGQMGMDTEIPSAGPPIGENGAAIGDAIAPVVVELAAELSRSLDYYASRNPAPAEKVVLCGGLAKLPGLAGYLQNALGVEVIVGDPFADMPVNAKRYSPEFLAEVGPVFATCVGLALRDFVGGENE